MKQTNFQKRHNARSEIPEIRTATREEEKKRDRNVGEKK